MERLDFDVGDEGPACENERKELLISVIKQILKLMSHFDTNARGMYRNDYIRCKARSILQYCHIATLWHGMLPQACAAQSACNGMRSDAVNCNFSSRIV